MLHLPAGKVEELYGKLNKKNAEIYLQRSKKMMSMPPRTRLFAWNMNNIEIMVCYKKLNNFEQQISFKGIS